ncbi:hypothetical protein DSO57_1006649 [Entomophthora muscae]|uniref:Uncharacterized protein n=1 Tax=Entomophthora muscae TaxID=34485 RepID=A0ACC2U5L6_9FUNG|nr:hypothetical protein DSO57_1006649 [Entomophthora muscae]
MSSLLKFERAKFGVLCVETAAARKEVPTSSLEEAWASLEVTNTVPAESLVEVKAEGTPAQGNRIYAWDAWNLLVGWDEILQQVKEMANHEIEALRAREGKSVKIMACWQDDNKLLSHKTASLDAKLLKALSQEGSRNKIQGQDNDRIDWLGLDPPQDCVMSKFHPFTIMRKLTLSDAANWDMFLPASLFSYRLSRHQVTGQSPFTMLYEQEANTPSSLGPL